MKRDYWSKRFDQVEEASHKHALAYQKELEREYAKAVKAIDEEISKWWMRFAKNNKVDIAEAKKMLNSNELKELKWTVEEYIRYGKENAIDQRWIKELENASAKFHISRLEALKLSIRQQIEKLTDSMTDDMSETLSNSYKETYYRSAFEIQKGTGVGYDFTQVDEAKLATVLKKPWSVDGANFSEKLWTNKTKLINVVYSEISQMVMTGSAPDKAIKNIVKTMETSKSNATRLVMTEQAYFTTLAQKDCFQELDVEEFEVVGTLDGITCSKCGSRDGEHYPLKYMESGVNAPPFHPYCRCTTCPYFADVEGYRASRDEEGRTVYDIPANMTYSEWKKAFVDGDKFGLHECGALVEKPENYKSRALIAKRLYDELNNINPEYYAKKVSDNTGIPEKAILRIYYYIFKEKHELMTGYRTFYKDYEMGVSFNRLRGNKKDILPHDILLLKHERLESYIVKRYNKEYTSVHRRVEKKYNYVQAYRDYYKSKGWV